MSDRRRIRQMQVAAILSLCVIPESLTVTEWADKYRVLPETSSSPGQYRSAVTPYARRPMDLMADPDVSLVVLAWATQTTKSTCIENAIGYRIHQQPAPLVVLRPKIDDGESFAKERLRPMVRSTPALRDRVRLGRSSGATMRYMPFPGGFVFVASAQSATEMASRSAPFILCDEVDRMEPIPGEGNPVEIVARRQGASDVGQLVITSTPRDAETSIVWSYLENGTYELYHVPCPHCGHVQPLVWRGIKWDKGKPETAAYVCGAADADDAIEKGCGALIEEREKPAMLAAGEWRATNPEGQYPSFHLPAWYSPFAKSSWGVIATEFVRAQGKPADLQVWTNTRACECWAETAEVADPESLLGRLEPMTEGEVPDGVGVLTAGVDVQANRLEVSVWGWGAGLESWLITHAILEGDPQREPDQPGSVWRRLDEVLLREYPRTEGGAMRVYASLIDSGFATSQVYRYTRNRRGQRIVACKGVGGEGIKVLGKPTLQGKEKSILLPVGVDEAKREFLRSQILERVPGPGFVHLPSWLTSDQCAAMVAEKRVRRAHRGRVSYAWVRKREDQPNEPLDCRIYARAALEHLGPATIAVLGQWAEKYQKAASEAATHKPKPAPVADPYSELSTEPPRHRSRPRRPGYVQRWRDR